MYYHSTFQELFKLIPRYRFDKIVKETSSDRYCKGFDSWKQFTTCLYAQITGKDSLRAIANGLIANQRRLYHLGMEAVSKSTFADAMNRRSPKIFEAIFNEMLARVLKLAPKHKFEFEHPLNVIDSTTIDLCLNSYNWALYRKMKGAIKLHVKLMLSEGGDIPDFVMMSNGLMSDIRAARENITIVPDSIYVVDRGYHDLRWFKHIDNSGAYFVSRLRRRAQIKFLGQHRQIDKNLGFIHDEMICYTEYESSHKYPGPLRLIEFYDNEKKVTYRFITNNLEFDSITIAEIYKKRWQIEIFFKWIKNNLKIKSFIGTSQNAVMTQIWVALIYYLLVTYIKFLHGAKLNPTELTWRIKDTLMMNFSLLEALNQDKKIIKKPPDWNLPQQLELFPNFRG